MITYCGSCAAKVEYQLTKPEKCPKCGKSISAAFKVEVKPTPTITYTPQAVASTPAPTPKPRVSRVIKPTKVTDEDGNQVDATEDDYFDPEEAHAAKEEILRNLNASTFLKPTPKNDDITTLGDIIYGRYNNF